MKKIFMLRFAATAFLICPFASSFAAMNWTCATSAAGWHPRYGHASVVFNNKMWVMGGIRVVNPPAQDFSDDTTYNDVWYSSNGATWTQATASANWPPRFFPTAVVFNNKMWLMGGEAILPGDTTTTYYNDVWYSTDGINWTQVDSIPWVMRAGHTLVVYDNKMWILGGWEYVSDVWYSPDGTNWTRASEYPMWWFKCFHSSVVFNNKMWMFGGVGLAGMGGTDDVWYSTDGINWTQATASAAWTPRWGHTSIVFNNMMLVIGGEDSSASFMKDVWYSSNGTGWGQATGSANWTGRAAHSSVLFDNKIWVIGGVNSDNDTSWNYYNDAWYSTGFGIEENNNQQLVNSKPQLVILQNPNPIIRLDLRLPAEKVEIAVFDLGGRERETIYSGALSKGTYSFTPKIRASGVYFVRLSCHSERSEESNKIEQSKKLILLK